MSVGFETPSASFNGGFAIAEERFSRRQWPFNVKLPLIQKFDLAGTSAEALVDSLKDCLREYGFSEPLNIAPGTQYRLFYRKESVYFGLLLAHRSMGKAKGIERRMRLRAGAWLGVFAGLAVFVGSTISEPRQGGFIPWSYVLPIFLASIPVFCVGAYYGTEVAWKWQWEQVVEISYCGLRPTPSASSAVANAPTGIRVWMIGGRVLAGGGALYHWERIGPDLEVESMALKWRDRITAVARSAAH
jgi:hypothetical protein